MFTQCPDCATVFRITADALRAAQGEVRCGVCSTSFNALENLSELSFKATTATGDEPVPEDTITVEEMPGNESIELSTSPELAAAADAADLDRLFAIEPPQPVSFDPVRVAASLSIHDAPANESEDDVDPGDDLARTDEHPILALDQQDDALEPLEPVESPEPTSSPFSSSRILIPDEMRKRLAEEAAARSALDSEFGTREDADTRQRWPLTLGVGVMLLLLAAQVVHSQRELLLRKAGVGPMLAQVYALVGSPLSVPTDLAAYELRQWGAASDPDEAGRLMLRASIVNRASYAQPFPLLRLALQDRFGATLGVRDIEPRDYLPGAAAPGLLQPGERADALIRIVDPGKEAVGFEMDVCIPAGNGVRCANPITTVRQ